MSDIFNIIWKVEDPLERPITLYDDIVQDRIKAGKHEGVEYLPVEKIKEIIEDPHRIDLTQKSPKHCEIFYRDEEGEEYKYARVVVAFDGDEGTAISWSRYNNHVSCVDIIYEKPKE